MSDHHDPTGPSGRDIPGPDWERLSMLLDGDLPDAEARELEREVASDPDLQAALGELQRMTAALRTVERAPAGFAERILERIEKEPVSIVDMSPAPWIEPANRPWRSWAQVAVLAVAAAAVLAVALPHAKPDPEAGAAKIDLQRVVDGVPEEAPRPAPAGLPVAEARKPEAPRPVASKGQPAPAPIDALQQGIAPVPAPAVEPEAGGTAEDPTAAPEPVGYAKRLQYRVQATTTSQLRNLAAKFGGGVTFDTTSDGASVARLTVPADRVAEFDLAMRKLGVRTDDAASSDDLVRGGAPLPVEITVDDLR